MVIINSVKVLPGTALISSPIYFIGLRLYRYDGKDSISLGASTSDIKL